MTKKEAAVVSAYTGFLIGEFSDMHRYTEQLFRRPVFTHEFGGKEFCNKLKDLSKPDFISMNIDN